MSAESPDMEMDETTEAEDVQVSHLVPRHVREAAKSNSEYGELSEKVRTLYQSVAFGEEIGERTQLENELKAIREKKDNKRAEKRELEREIENLEKRETRLEERVSSLSSKEDKFEGAIEMLEQQLYEGTHIWPEHGTVKKAAGLGEGTPEQVIQKLKERNPGIPDYAFQPLAHAESRWHGCEAKEAKAE